MIHPPQDSASSPIDNRRLTARQSAEYFLNIVRLLDKSVDIELTRFDCLMHDPRSHSNSDFHR